MTEISIENYLSYTKVIQNLNLKSEDAYNQLIEIYRQIRFFPIINFEMKVEYEMPLFRSRVSTKSHFYENFSSILNPPEKYVTNYGRANVPNQSILYMSENIPTSYLEIVHHKANSVKVGDLLYVTTSEWVHLNNLNLLIIKNPYSKDSNYDKIHQNGIDHAIQQYPENLQEAGKLFLAFIADMFSIDATNREEIYKLTSSFSNFIQSGMITDGIMYPSVPYEKKGYNVALNPKISRENILHMTHVHRDVFEIELKKNGKFNFQQVDKIVAKSFDNSTGEICW